MSDAPVTTVDLVGGVGTIAASATFRAASAAAHTFPGAASGAVLVTAASGCPGTAGNELWGDFDVKRDDEGAVVQSAPLTFVVSPKGAKVFLATNGSGVVTSTAAQVASGWNASPASAFASATPQSGGAGVVAASGFALLAGGQDAVVMPVGTRFRVDSFDATDVTILPFIDNESDYYAATDPVVVTLAALLAACAPDAPQ